MTSVTFNIPVSIVVLAYNQWEYTAKCLASLEKTIAADWPVEVCVVDNGSTDRTPKEIKKWISTAHLNAKCIRLDCNVGVSGGYNAGAGQTDGQIVVYMNNDIVGHENWLPALIKKFEEDGETGIVGARLLYPDGRVQHAGVAVSDLRLPYHIYRGLKGEALCTQKSREFSGVTGACFAARRELINATGGLDEAYWLGYEDIDFCCKVKAAGAKIWYAGAAVLTHHEGVTVGVSPTRKNIERFLDKWKETIKPDHARIYGQDGYSLAPLKTFIRSRINAIPSDHSLYIYGGGSHTAQLLNVCKDVFSSNVFRGILDKESGKNVHGYSTIRPDTVENPGNAWVILSSANFEPEMLDYLLQHTAVPESQIIPLYRPMGYDGIVPNVWDDFYFSTVICSR